MTLTLKNLKFILIGDSYVGKTSVIYRFSQDYFDTIERPTVGLDYRFKTLELNGNKVLLKVWDTAGQERFNTITTSFYRGSDGIMLVYDVTKKQSFDNISKWLRKIKEHADENVEKVLLGNKCDLDDKREISKEKGEALAKEHGMKYFETSAKCDVNIREAFLTIATDILNKKPSDQASRKQGIIISSKTNKKNKYCC